MGTLEGRPQRRQPGRAAAWSAACVARATAFPADYLFVAAGVECVHARPAGKNLAGSATPSKGCLHLGWPLTKISLSVVMRPLGRGRKRARGFARGHAPGIGRRIDGPTARIAVLLPRSPPQARHVVDGRGREGENAPLNLCEYHIPFGCGEQKKHGFVCAS